jgi:peptide/nickel transport system substrate-binding protein
VDAINEFRQNPTGTGPYKVESFAENDQVIYVPNEHYREPNKPFFERVNLKGGGDAASAARAVLETGDWDFAWNLQVEPQILAQMAEAGKGKVYVGRGANVERVLFNFSNPNEEFEGQRSNWRNPHPFLTDKAVRQAMSLACDRLTMSEQFYEGPDAGEPPATNIVTGIAALESPNNTWEYNLETAKQILDEAGWVMDGDVRKKDGVELSISYSTSINAVRQKNQAVNKQNWEELGIKVQLKQVDAGIFFDSAAGNDQNASHFFTDIQMYTNGPGSPIDLLYMQGWYAGPDGSNIAQQANGWSGQNDSRYNNPEYDALYDQLVVATDPEAAAELFIRMNDIVIQEFVVIPLVNRAAEKVAILNTLREANLGLSQWEPTYWNIANWNRVS